MAEAAVVPIPHATKVIVVPLPNAIKEKVVPITHATKVIVCQFLDCHRFFLNLTISFFFLKSFFYKLPIIKERC